MLTWLWWLLVGPWHVHDWEVVQQGPLADEGTVVGYYCILKCKSCHELKLKSAY